VSTFTLLIDGRPAFTGLTPEETDALVRRARDFTTDPAVQSGCRIDTVKEEEPECRE
jgi:hypothetical protein